jgi:hypothetical protein
MTAADEPAATALPIHSVGPTQQFDPLGPDPVGFGRTAAVHCTVT